MTKNATKHTNKALIIKSTKPKFNTFFKFSRANSYKFSGFLNFHSKIIVNFYHKFKFCHFFKKIYIFKHFPLDSVFFFLL